MKINKDEPVNNNGGVSRPVESIHDEGGFDNGARSTKSSRATSNNKNATKVVVSPK